MGSWTSRIVDRGVDPYGLGRWSFLVLRGTGDTKIMVITAYRVCDNKSSGSKTAYR